MDFDKTLSRDSYGTKIEYGILYGSEKILFVKSGNGGTYCGRDGKYLRFAEFVRNTYGCSVICASNPLESRISYGDDMSVICEYIASRKFTEPELYLLGNSDGCFKVIDISSTVQAAKTVIINMPLMINFYKTKEKIKSLPSKDIIFVYGEHDPSQIYLDYLKTLPFGEFVILQNTAHKIAFDEKQSQIIAELLFK